MNVTIYHNPACQTSRKTLALIREAGIEPVVVKYLETPPSRLELETLMARAGLKPRQVLREKEKLLSELGYDVAAMRDDEILDAMMAHPILINRPIVVSELGVRLCRPQELVLEILPK